MKKWLSKWHPTGAVFGVVGLALVAWFGHPLAAVGVFLMMWGDNIARAE